MQLCLNLPQLALPIGTRVLILEGEHRGKTGRVFETINTLHLINLKGCRTTLHRNQITPIKGRKHTELKAFTNTKTTKARGEAHPTR